MIKFIKSYKTFLITILFLTTIIQCQKSKQISNEGNQSKVIQDTIQKVIYRKYSTPYNLKWGDSLRNAKKVLTYHYKFDDSIYDTLEHLNELIFSGDYAGFFDSKIMVDANSNGIISFGALIPKQSEVAISTTWKNAVKKMIDKYGDPDSINLPPKKF